MQTLRSSSSLVRAVLVLLMLAAVAGVALARQEGSAAVVWFSQRVVALPGHPIRLHPHYDMAPGPMVVWFVRDTYNPRTCLALVTNQGTGQVYGPTAVDPTSCDYPR